MGDKLKKAFEVLKINPGQADSEPRKIELNGATFLRQDYSRAQVEGQPAHAIAVAGAAPGRPGGYVILVGFALFGHESSEEDLRDAANSISRS